MNLRKTAALGAIVAMGILASCSRSEETPLGPGGDAIGFVGAPRTDTGSVGMHLTVPPGVNIDALAWTIAGVDSLGDPCTGSSAPVTVVATATSVASLLVECVVPTDAALPSRVDSGNVAVDAGVVVQNQAPYGCPGITGVSVSPADIPDTATAALSATVVGGAGGTPTLAWTSSCGTIASPTSPDATFSWQQHRDVHRDVDGGPHRHHPRRGRGWPGLHGRPQHRGIGARHLRADAGPRVLSEPDEHGHLPVLLHEPADRSRQLRLLRDAPDLAGGAPGSGAQECLATLGCIFQSDCQGNGGIAGTSAGTAQESVNLCYCGGNNAGSLCNTGGTATNGLCVTLEAAGFGFPFQDNKDILANFESPLFPSGIANEIFSCAASNQCTLCK